MDGKEKTARRNKTLESLCSHLDGEIENGAGGKVCEVNGSRIYPRVWLRGRTKQEERAPLNDVMLTIEREKVEFMSMDPEIETSLVDATRTGDKDAVILNRKYFINEDGEIGIVESEHLKEKR